mmetsp:Transcript_31665/g.36004  ORF Transcript_31665/g.36004 Transcript_31665/m.36004 type:complete len:356 (-) Transcript_31665:121-1188(-)
MSLCATIGRSQNSESIAESRKYSADIDNYSLNDDDLLKDEKVFIFDLPDKEDLPNQNNDDDDDLLLEDFPSRDGDVLEDFPKTELDDDEKSVTSIWSAISNLSLGSKRSNKSKKKKNINPRAFMVRRKKRLTTRAKSSDNNNSDEKKGADDNNNNQEECGDEEEEDHTSTTKSLFDDQTEFFESDPVDKLMLKLTKNRASSRRQVMMPTTTTSDNTDDGELMSSEMIVNFATKNPLDKLIEKLGTKAAEDPLKNKQDNDDDLLPPSLLYEEEESRNTLTRQFSSDRLDEILESSNTNTNVIHTTLKPTQLTQMKIRDLLEERNNNNVMPPIAERSERTDRSFLTNTDRSETQTDK